MSNFVFVLDTNKQRLNPVHPGEARRLLNQGKAAVFRQYPFTIILKQEVKAEVRPLQLKIDPGSRTTGLAILNGSQVIWAAELTHRGQAIKDALLGRRQLRRARRNRKTRYRAPRFLNRARAEGWLAPSLMHRVKTTLTWVNRLCRYAPIAGISQELVRFDTQAIQNPEISGTEYQQGTLAGYEVREYLLEKWGRKCAYCKAKNTPLQIEHIQPRSKGGSDRVANLTLACEPCNGAKSNLPVQEFLSGKPDLLKCILAQAKAPLKDAAAVNSTRWALFKALKGTELPVTTGSGGQTKYNRTNLGLPKTHWLDAACVGKVEQLQILTTQPLLIRATGHGSRQMCGTNKYGFPTRHRSRVQIHKGFQTGDIVVATVTAGKKIGSYLGRVLCRASGSFDIATKTGRVAGISHKYCKPIHKKDGYAYAF
ncbi:RNA-guided endonuclease IscB [Geitlerinema calcuttense]|uniref:RNA-guided endonuclease IscB n=1 Tax=Geitlerinema calcuttense NRMC-F 0142 TaxID=2922238 RepID=A0ABT7LW24_9CYAN|nr:RNA-guided endonuclease IscB [Geitlerinema calcuttense]MCD8488500.1 RNA-guided endonuclease IscB [Desertifilum sp.]MDL5056228.1 RNA-guided endonuclease IscB [Geitlerinema calcuttense NRMC-F 0142]